MVSHFVGITGIDRNKSFFEKKINFSKSGNISNIVTFLFFENNIFIE